jgi:predicted RNA-binding Zn-ribbon protein involved in translation (DUF1610 family)
MTCPKCGTQMNHQAQKLVDPVTAEEAVAVTAVFDGVLLVVFACPGCGWIDSRRETGEPTASA